MSQPPLPDNWEELTAADGEKYYYNSETQATSWLRPELTAAEKRARSSANDSQDGNGGDSEGELPPGYEEHLDEDGTAYYYHVPTGHVSWTRPAAGAGSKERHSNAGESEQSYSARV
jgi:hypothetical protein